MNIIPKKIHYCWFGRNELPELAERCIESWKKYCPNYEIIEWNENNFNIESNLYVKEAYEKGKYAFITDYVRLYVLYEYGGIYMDTDVEVIKPIDKFLEHSAFTGCENDNYCVTGIMASEKKHPWIGELLSLYDNKRFILQNGKIDITPNTELITKSTISEYGWKKSNNYQVLKNDLHIYPHETFCAKDWRNGKINITDNTYTIHNFAGSLITDKDKKKDKRNRCLKSIIVKCIGKRGFESLNNIRKNYF